MKIVSSLLVASAAATCPYVNWSKTPNESQLYPEMRDSVVKTPSLLRDADKNAFLGTMGPCGNSSLY
jgi:hypothetical protein